MSANKQRDWLDYAGLASQLYQNVQVNDVRNKMAAVGQIALIAEERERHKALAEQTLRNGKEALFKFTSVLDKLKAKGGSDLRASLLFALKMKRVLNACGLSTELFSDIDDKARLTRLHDELDDFIAEAKVNLTDPDGEIVYRCELYRLDMRRLEALIKVKRIAENNAKRDRVAAQVNASRRKRFDQIKEVQPYRTGVAAFAFGLFAAFLVILLGALTAGTPSNTNSVPFSGFLFLGIGVVVIAGMLGVGLQGSNEARTRNALHEERARLATQLELDANRITPQHAVESTFIDGVEFDEGIVVPRDDNTSRQLEGIDETMNRSELETIRQERIQFIFEITGERMEDWEITQVGVSA
jgi:hypothetical protein